MPALPPPWTPPAPRRQWQALAPSGRAATVSRRQALLATLGIMGVASAVWFGRERLGADATASAPAGSAVSPAAPGVRLPSLPAATPRLPTASAQSALPTVAVRAEPAFAALATQPPEPTMAAAVPPTPTVPPTSSPLLPTAESNPTPGRNVEAEVERLLAGMAVEQKVGQLLMVGFPGTGADVAVGRIRSFLPGSIVFWQNTASPAQTRALTAELQRVATEVGARLPLFISVDHEGGDVQRLRDGVAYFPGKLVLGATHSEDLARLEGQVEGRELRAMGINMNLGPVLDVDTNASNPIIGRYQRSLGANPRTVSRLGRAYLQGLQSQGVLGVLKYFPGHGATGEDSHLTLPTMQTTRAQLDAVELVPFRDALPEAASVMTAHILFQQIDPRWPSSLSPTFVTSILRDQLEYDGLVMTDDTGGMAAITGNYAPGAAAIQAFQAGTDMIMVVGDLERQHQVHQGLLEAVARGAISHAALDTAVRRILRSKVRFGLLDDTPVDDLSIVGSDEHLAAVQQVANAAITVVQDQGRLVPAGAGVQRPLVISPNSLPIEGGGTRLGRRVREQRPEAREVRFSLSGDNSGVLAQALGLADWADLAVVATVNAGPWQRRLVQQLQERGVPTIVIGFGAPYELTALGIETTYVAAYAPRAELVDAAVSVLFGDIAAAGRLPIPVGSYRAGHAANRREPA